MMTIQTKEFVDRIRSLTKDEIVQVQFPVMPRSGMMIVPSIAFLRETWKPWWDGYRKSRGLHNFNQSLCDLVSGAAALEMNWACGIKATDLRIDATAACCEARINLYAHLLGVEPPDGKETGHANCLLALTEDDSNWEIAFWEPQSPIGSPFEYETLKSVLDRFACDLHDVLV